MIKYICEKTVGCNYCTEGTHWQPEKLRYEVLLSERTVCKILSVKNNFTVRLGNISTATVVYGYILYTRGIVNCPVMSGQFAYISVLKR